MYHRIGRVRRDSIVPGQYVSPGLFARHVRLLQRLGFTGTTVGACWDESTAPQVCFTFDDAYASVSHFALPVLNELGWKSTLFVVSNFVGSTNVWDEEVGDVSEALMSHDQIFAAMACGHELGAHSRTHPRLPLVADRSREIVGNRDELARIFGTEAEVFCYPYGAEDSAIREEVRSAGFRYACATTKGAWRRDGDPYRIPRINMRSTTWTLRFFSKILQARRSNGA
jgi:peptidoglycan/xylan/chitin deacetylase (PgdA/CDA1 family)